MKDLISNLTPYLFAICCVAIFGGAVNLGAFSFIPAIPYLLVAIVISLKVHKKYKLILLTTLIVSTPCYFLVQQGGELVYPSLNKTIVTMKDTCLTTYDSAKKKSAHINTRNAKEKCRNQKKSTYVPAGSQFTIDQIVVSHANFAEKYIIRSKTKNGLLYFPLWKNEVFKFQNGKMVQESDLWNPIFYYPSLLMYGPALILLLL
jgi:hypothetical protein